MPHSHDLGKPISFLGDCFHAIVSDNDVYFSLSFSLSVFMKKEEFVEPLKPYLPH